LREREREREYFYPRQVAEFTLISLKMPLSYYSETIKHQAGIQALEIRGKI
jgi:hypothetical protein